MNLDTYRDLEGADIKIDYSKLDDSFWESVHKI